MTSGWVVLASPPAVSDDPLASALKSVKGTSPGAVLPPEQEDRNEFLTSSSTSMEWSPLGVALSLGPAEPAPGAREEPLDDDTAIRMIIRSALW